MKRSFLMTAALLGAALPFAAAQDLPPDGKQDRDGKEAPMKAAPLEVRVYLWEKNARTPADPKDWTATLQVESKDGLKKTVPMMLTQPRPDDRMMLGHEGQMKEVEGTNWWCEFVVVKPVEKKDAPSPKEDPGPRAPEDKGRTQDKGAEDWKKPHTHAGPYFKAELSGVE